MKGGREGEKEGGGREGRKNGSSKEGGREGRKEKQGERGKEGREERVGNGGVKWGKPFHDFLSPSVSSVSVQTMSFVPKLPLPW